MSWRHYDMISQTSRGLRCGTHNKRKGRGQTMARRVFYSFHFDHDYWRVMQVRNIGAIEGQTILAPNEWEEVKRKGKASIQNWIDNNMSGRSCVVVLIGSETADREWVDYEIKRPGVTEEDYWASTYTTYSTSPVEHQRKVLILSPNGT